MANLCIKRMPSSVIISNFVAGFQDSNYEIFLRELLNSSTYFLNRGKSPFCEPNSESHGECDAISRCYELDFKLLASQTELMAASILEEQPMVLSDGLVAYTECKVPGGCVTATRLHAALRELSMDDLKNIRHSKTNRTNIENDLPQVLETAETKKNLLYLFPYKLWFDSKIQHEKALELLMSSLQNDLTNLLLYREEVCPGFDTFITALFDDNFIIFWCMDGELHLVDTVPAKQIPTYNRLDSFGNILK